jgi:hypothetical protein
MSEKEKDVLELADDFLLSGDQELGATVAVDLIERLYAELEDSRMKTRLLCIELNKLTQRFTHE